MLIKSAKPFSVNSFDRVSTFLYIKFPKFSREILNFPGKVNRKIFLKLRQGQLHLFDKDSTVFVSVNYIFQLYLNT